MHPEFIVALDTPDTKAAWRVVEQLGPRVSIYKLGLEMLFNRDFFGLFDDLKDAGKQVFVDGKFLDTPRTVEAATRQVVAMGADMLTIHAHQPALHAAAKARGMQRGLKLWAVTALTSTRDTPGLPEDVACKTRMALQAGFNGVIASGHDAPMLRQSFGTVFEIASPGIRLGNIGNDDQQRVCTPFEAARNTANYLVVGRPVMLADDPAAAMDALFANRDGKGR